MPMLTPTRKDASEAPEILAARLAEWFERSPETAGITTAYLFGSAARGTARPGSDIDVAVLYQGEPPRGLERFRLEGELERHLRRPVQVVSLNQASPDLVHRVLRDGHLLLEKSPAHRIAFEVQKRLEYLDLEPLRRLYRRWPEPAR
jgi:predicted nucleotidyltransferase